MIEDYFYTKSEFYQYYETIKDESSIPKEENEGNKVCGFIIFR